MRLKRFGSIWVLVCPLVFKTSVGGEELPGWVRFPHIPAKSAAIFAALFLLPQGIGIFFEG